MLVKIFIPHKTFKTLHKKGICVIANIKDGKGKFSFLNWKATETEIEKWLNIWHSYPSKTNLMQGQLENIERAVEVAVKGGRLQEEAVLIELKVD